MIFSRCLSSNSCSVFVFAEYAGKGKGKVDVVKSFLADLLNAEKSGLPVCLKSSKVCQAVQRLCCPVRGRGEPPCFGDGVEESGGIRLLLLKINYTDLNFEFQQNPSTCRLE
jgi:hypothetical protein